MHLSFSILVSVCCFKLARDIFIFLNKIRILCLKKKSMIPYAPFSLTKRKKLK